MREYRIEVWTNGRWEVAKVVHGSRSLADGLLNQFRAQYTARIVDASGSIVSRGNNTPKK